MTASIPIYRYTVTRKPQHVPQDGVAPAQLLPAPLTVDAMSVREDDIWLIFDDTVGSVLTVRIDSVEMVQRSPEPVSGQTVDELTDPIDPQDLT